MCPFLYCHQANSELNHLIDLFTYENQRLRVFTLSRYYSRISLKLVTYSFFTDAFIWSLVCVYNKKGGQAFGPLVSVSSTHRCAYTPDLSTR